MIGVSPYYGAKAKWIGSGEEGRATTRRTISLTIAWFRKLSL